MSTQLQIFRFIVVHNKLMSEADIDALLAQTRDPARAVQAMVQRRVITPEVSNKLMVLYQRKVAAHVDVPAEDPAAKAPAATPAPRPPAAAPPSSAATAVHTAVPTATPPPASASVRIAQAAQSVYNHAPAAGSHAPAPPAPAPSVSVESIATRVKVSTHIDTTRPGKQLIHQLLTAARAMNASDLHVRSAGRPMVRVASHLREMDLPVLSEEVVQQSLLELLNPIQSEHFQTHHDIDFCYDGGPELGRFRTNFLSEFRGTDGVFRLISSRVPSFDELRLPEQIKKFTQYRQGIVLITGPKGCGKTTTLAALIDLINANRQEHIITIEDPIEFVHPCKKGHVNQREVGPHTKSFSNALRAALREAPDVIMVGEMRDLETTSLAITAAETGHLVFATLHTPDAVKTIGRVLDVFPPKEQGQVRAMFSESLRGIVSQLLIPSADNARMEMATEIMFNTSAIANLIREARTFQLKGQLQTGKKLGMMTMDDSLIELAKAGKISKHDAVVRSDNQAYVEKEIARQRDVPTAA